MAPFKVGPDFIDPGHHGQITGSISRNLDGWMLSQAQNKAIFSMAAKGADLAVVEGVMGLFDGYDGRSEAGSTAQMAKWLGAPVLLIVNAASMARSAAALVQGFERFDPELSFTGILLNRIGSPRHLDYLKEALDGAVNMPVVGGIPRTETVEIPERHLGLHTADDYFLAPDRIQDLAELIESAFNLDAFIESLPDVKLPSVASAPPVPEGRQVRIGVARDRSFCFYYQDNLDLLEISGAEIVPFSPLSDASLPGDLDGLYLGGGYPELAAEALSANRSMRRSILRASADGMPIYAECGGFMYLCNQLIDVTGRAYPMTGCFPFTTRMYARRKALGYREVTLNRRTILGPAGRTIRGHEFHYSDIADLEPSVPTVYQTAPRHGVSQTPQGYAIRNTLGSYVHLHFNSCQEAAADFVGACQRYRRERTTSAT